MHIAIDPGAAAVLDALHRAGHRAYLVGGCVRDSLAGRAPQDWTSAPAPGRTRPWRCLGKHSASPPACSTAPSPSGRAGACMR